jgi:cytochrome c
LFKKSRRLCLQRSREKPPIGFLIDPQFGSQMPEFKKTKTCNFLSSCARHAWMGAMLFMFALGPCQNAGAQPLGNSERGGILGQAWCSSCHVVRVGDRAAVNDAVPGFQEIADRTSTTATSLRVFLQTPHLQMPNEVLSVAQTNDLIAYILSLKR